MIQKRRRFLFFRKRLSHKIRPPASPIRGNKRCCKYKDYFWKLQIIHEKSRKNIIMGKQKRSACGTPKIFQHLLCQEEEGDWHVWTSCLALKNVESSLWLCYLLLCYFFPNFIVPKGKGEWEEGDSI